MPVVLRLRLVLCGASPEPPALGSAIPCVSFQSRAAIGIGSSPNPLHHLLSLLARCSSRWWLRHSGTVNSSLTLRLSAGGWAKRKWCGSDGSRPHTKQAFVATNRRWALSRRRGGAPYTSACLSTPSNLEDARDRKVVEIFGSSPGARPLEAFDADAELP